MTVIAVIPARSGSRRVKDKNIRNLAGHPLIYYTIHEALKAKSLDMIYISTDSHRYAEIALEIAKKAPSFNWIKRPPDLAMDVDTTLVLKHVIQEIERPAFKVDYVVTLQCFPEGTDILTNASICDITEIDESTFVLTHKGTYEAVYDLFRRKYSGPMVSIRALGLPKILVTPEHPILIFRSGKLTWREAKNLKIYDYVISPKLRKTVDKDSLEIWNEGEIKNWRQKRAFKRLPKSVKVDKNLLRLLGVYVAEGSITQRSILRFSVGKHEKKLTKQILHLMRKVFGLEGKIQEVNPSKSAVNIRYCSKYLCRFFSQFYSNRPFHTRNKQIPNWLMYLPKGKLVEFIKGVWEGDGNYTEKRGSGCFQYTTSSKKLAWQLHMTIHKLGIFTSMEKKNRSGIKIRGRTIKSGDIYILRLKGAQAVKFGELLGIPTVIPKGMNSYNHFVTMKDYTLLPISQIKIERYDGDVYNFAVKNTESYVANGIAVHNCTSPFRTAKDIDACVNIIKHSRDENMKPYDTVLTVTDVKERPEWMLRYCDKAKTRMVPFLNVTLKGNMLVSQNLPKLYYYPTGAVYVNTRELIMKHERMFGWNIYGYYTPPERSIDIETEMDFKVAECLMREVLNRR